MNQFTIITKDGSKWLRPVNSFDNNDPRFTSKEPFCMLGMRPCSKTVCECDEWKKFEKNNPILPYIGCKPAGSTVDESEVTAITQARHKDYTGSDWFNVYDNGNWDYYQTRTAYTDAESHNRNISDNPRYPLFSHMSSEHGLTLLDSELDEIAHHAAPMTGVDYWKRRCEAAEQLVGIGFLHVEFMNLLDRCGKRDKYDEWKQIIEEGRAYGN